MILESIRRLRVLKERAVTTLGVALLLAAGMATQSAKALIVPAALRRGSGERMCRRCPRTRPRS